MNNADDNDSTLAATQDAERRVLGLLRSLLDIYDDRTRATLDWLVLAPRDEDDARALLNAALMLLLQVASDPRLGGRDEVIGKLTSLSLKYEHKYGQAL